LNNAALETDKRQFSREIVRGNYEFKFPRKATKYGDKIKLIAS